MRTLILSSCLVVLTGAICWSQNPHAALDPVDADRAGRYVSLLKSLEQRRVAVRDRASSLVATNPALQRDIQMALQNEMVATGVLRNTPAFVGIPNLVQGFTAYRGHDGNSDHIHLRPQLFIWYTFQDNTFLRQSLIQSIYASRQNATNSYMALQENLVALEEIARDADEMFLRYRREADFMGRRSGAELSAAAALTEQWTNDDPFHAGATLVRAYALRTAGKSDECTKLLSTLDNNFPVMESITDAVSAQVAYLNDDLKEANRLLDQAVAQARQSGTTEAYLVYGWIALAAKDYDAAEKFAGRARQVQSSPTSKADIEVSILEALATAYARPTRSRDALQLLRRAQLSTTSDDWHYREALAIIHLMAKDKLFAKREIDAALQSAPSFIRAELENEKAAIDAGDLPQIDWKARLKLLWQHP